MDKKTVVFVFISVILIILSPFVVSGAYDTNNQNTIFLRSGNLDTDLPHATNESDYAQIKTSSISGITDHSDRYYIVQFDGPVREEWRNEVNKTGAEFFDYVPDNAFVLRTNETGINLLESLGFVRWTGEYLPEYKYDFSLKTVENQILINEKKDKTINLNVFIFESEKADEITQAIIDINGKIISISDRLLTIALPENQINSLVSINGICWIEECSEVVLFNDVASRIIKADTIHNDIGLSGSGQIIAVCDTGLDIGVDNTSIHPDFSGRIIKILDYSNDGAADDAPPWCNGGHGTHVAGSVLGDGSMSGGKYKGIVPRADLVFQAVQNNDGSMIAMEAAINNSSYLKTIFQDAYGLGAKIHTNSWGYETYLGNYTIPSRIVDDFMWEHPDILIIFAAGNFGTDIDEDGKIDINSISHPSTSKNCIAVGASETNRPDKTSVYYKDYYKILFTSPILGDQRADNQNGIAAFSSRGPTDDGRIKPDIVAPGTYVASTRSSLVSWYEWGMIDSYYAYLGGTSMSAPIVAGAAALVREYYTEIEGLENPSAALMKATLLNGAYDMTPGQYGEGSTQEIAGRPDYSQGWGRLDVENSILVPYPQVIAYFDNEYLSTSQSWNHSYEYIKGNEPLRATLAWTDYPGAVYSSKNLVNDLDMVISTPTGIYYGNNGPDRTNNVEGIELKNVAEGNHTITIIGHNVIHGPQPFALVLSFTCNNKEFPSPGSYAPNSSTPVSTDLVHPLGVNPTSIQMMINDIPVSFSTLPIPGGYSISYNTPTPYPAGEYNVSVTALTATGQQFSYGWKFNVTSSSSKSITSFNFTDPAVAGNINETARTISITVPYGTDVTSLTPTIVHTGASIIPENGVAQNFTNPVTYTVTAEDGTTQSYTVTVTSLPNPAKSITSFSFTDPEATGNINETARTISITVPYGTDVTSLTPTIVHTGASIIPENGVAQNFTNPVTYTVTAEDGTTQSYTVTVTSLPNPAKSITSFSFTDPEATGNINETARTISITVPYGTDVTNLNPSIVHTGASINPENGVAQNFTNPVTYTVTAEDGTTQSYTVTVTSLPNPAKSMTSFSFTDPEATGNINETARTISITVPYGTDVTSLTPTIVHTEASIIPENGVAQNFTNPVTYTVTAEDGTTQSYTVTVTSLPNPAKSITSFSFTDPEATGNINETARTISITVPYGTDVTNLNPSIVHTGASINPENGVAQNFTNPVTYTVTAEDGTTRSYTVTVTSLLNPAKSITGFSFTDPAVAGVINEAARTVSITVPYATDVTSLTPTIDYTGANITPGNGIAQDFTNPVTYTVTAEDGTTRSYTVTVTSTLNPAKSITGFSFTDPAVDGVINEAARTVSVTVPYATDVTSLTPTIDYTGANITPGNGIAQDFTNPVTYTVTAEDGTTRSYTVTVTSTLNPAKSITGFSFTDPAATGEINEAARTVSITVPYGTDVTNLIPSIVHTGASITPGSGVAQDFTNPVIYTVTAEDGTTRSYTVTVTSLLNPAKSITGFSFTDPAVAGVINEAARTVSITVPYATDVTSLTPTIDYTGANITPGNGIAQDFTSPVTYTVTAVDLTTQEYEVTVTVSANPAKAITSFDFEALSVAGIVDEEAKTVAIAVPYGTDVTSLTPTIVHTGASVSPDSGVAQDFSNPVTYTVTAADSTTQEYVVTVTVAANPTKSITSFEFETLSVVGIVDEEAKTVAIAVPYGTDVTSLTPTIVHTGASISPDSGVDKDFSNPVTYTVTADDSTIQHYTVTVNVAPNTAKEITSFKFTDPAVDGVINETAKTVNMTVPYGTNVTALVPTIAHTGETISPNTGVAQNFTKPITYIVTAIDATTQEYVVTVRVSGSSTATTSTSTTNGGGGGGGGGGGATGEEFENIEFKDVSSIFVGRDMSVSFEFRNDDSDIRYIAYDSLKNAGTISATIEVLKGRSSFADTLPEGIVYRNINIWVGKTGYAIPENIEGPIIGFRVPGSWIDANDIDVDSIVLNRYDGRWSRLPTLQTGANNNYLYFEASTPGFSPFAITGESLNENRRLESVPEILNSPADEIATQTNISILNDTMPDKTLNSISGIASILILFIACFLRRKQ